jgi:hypothetical protein
VPSVNPRDPRGMGWVKWVKWLTNWLIKQLMH